MAGAFLAPCVKGDHSSVTPGGETYIPKTRGAMVGSSATGACGAGAVIGPAIGAKGGHMGGSEGGTAEGTQDERAIAPDAIAASRTELSFLESCSWESAVIRFPERS